MLNADPQEMAAPRPRGASGTALRRALTLAALGALLGPLLDYGHLRTGAIAYDTPITFGVPWWVSLVYVGAAVGIGMSHPEWDRLLGRRRAPSLTPTRLAAGIVCLAALWMASGLLPLSSLAICGVLGVAALGVWWVFDGAWQGLVEGAATAAGGVLVEIVLVRGGLFHHRDADVLGVALWLPWLYVAGSVAIGNVGRWLAGGHAR